MKNWIIFSSFLCLFLLIGSVSGETLSVSGIVVDEKTYESLAPCYTDNLIKSYGPVPVFDKEHRIASRGIMADYSGFVERDALYKKLHNVYEATWEPVTSQYSYPNGPVLSYGLDIAGSMVIGVYENESIDQKMMDEIYSIAASESKKQGIDDVPVIFCKEPMVRLDLGRSDVWRPVIGGVQIGSSLGAPTSGFAVTRGGVNGIVTAGHIGNVGSTVYQPDLSSPIGTVTVSSLGTSPDSSWVQYSNIAGKIFESSGSQPNIYGTTNAYGGLGVIMSGISSGVSTGTVIREGALYNSFFGKTISGQWYADFPSTSGDSGAPVYFKDANGHIQLVGLYWGRGTYATFSPISSVLSDLS
jgi:hypothetical protein